MYQKMETSQIYFSFNVVTFPDYKNTSLSYSASFLSQQERQENKYRQLDMCAEFFDLLN